MQYVTLEQVKAQCNVDATLTIDDGLLEDKANAAEAAVLEYLDDEVPDAFMDSSGTPATDTDPPPQVVEAILTLTAILYRYRDDPNLDGKVAHGYLPFAVTMLLYPLRDPALA
jgi:hypothetical protein